MIESINEKMEFDRVVFRCQKMIEKIYYTKLGKAEFDRNQELEFTTCTNFI